MKATRIFLLGMLAVLCGSRAALAHGSPFAAPAARHFYLAVSSESAGLEILRYPLVQGFPASTPDFAYPNVTSPMVVGPDGTLYATIPLGCCFGQNIIEAFPFGERNPTREITLPQLSDTTVDSALAVGPHNDLFVGYDSFISGDESGLSESGIVSGSIPNHGIAVYGPTAHGSEPPLAAFKFAGIEGGPADLTFGPQGDLYASGFGAHGAVVTEIASPLGKPRVVSKLYVSLGLFTAGLKFSDDGRNLYVLTTTGVPIISRILVYPFGAHGSVSPSRVITLADNLGPSLAIEGMNAYTVSVPVLGQIAELIAYPKHANGSPPPSFQREYSQYGNTFAVTVGP